MNERSLEDQAYQSVRPYLFSVAYRMTGSASDAEDLVQDAWIRYLDAGSPAVESLRAWMTTTVSRLALDYLKSARVTREAYVGVWLPEPVPTTHLVDDPQTAAESWESTSLAFVTLMERLTPDQRVVFVLREGVGLAYDEIARHVGKSAAACRQVFRRAQDRLAGNPRQRRLPAEHSRLLDAFGAAIAAGNVHALTSLLREDATWIGDGGADRLSVRRTIVGADRIARGLTGLWARYLRSGEASTTPTSINGEPALAVYRDRMLDQVFAIETLDGRIRAVRSLRNPVKLAYLDRALRAERDA